MRVVRVSGAVRVVITYYNTHISPGRSDTTANFDLAAGSELAPACSTARLRSIGFLHRPS
jgi:hypothetical protein